MSHRCRVVGVRRRFWNGVAALALCSSAVGGLVSGVAHAQTAPTLAPLKVGLIGPFSGPSSDFGLPMQNGVRMAVDEINAVGGYLGRPLELVVVDDKADPVVGRQGSESLVAANVVAAIGFCNTGVAMASLEVFQKAKVPLIVPCAAGSPVTAKYPGPESYIFRTSPRDAIQAPFVVADILKRGWNRVAIFADTTGYGEAGLRDVEAALAERKLKPAYVARYALGVKDLDRDLEAARQAGANVIFTYTVGPENAVIAKGRQAMKWSVPLVGGWPLSFPFFIDGGGAAAEGALMAQTFIAEPSNERRAHGRRPGLRQRVPAHVCAVRDSFGATRRPRHQGGIGEHAAQLLRRGGHVRATLQRRGQGRRHAQHAGDGAGEKRRHHLCLSGRRQTQPVRPAQALTNRPLLGGARQPAGNWRPLGGQWRING